MVHATCVPLRNRSHFDAQDNLENGLPGLTANATGWLNRLLTALPAGAPIKSKGAIQIGDAPLILRGPAPVLGWSPTWFTHVKDPTLYLVRTLYRESDPQLLSVLDQGLRADRLAERGDADDGNISRLRKGFRGAGRLVAAADGPRIAVLSVGGFDTHSDQGAAAGALADVLGELDRGIADFKTMAGSAWSQTVMVLVTEFGRTVRVNGDDGTDHGVGTVALLAGGAVNGGKVFGDWPGLAPREALREERPQADHRHALDLQGYSARSPRRADEPPQHLDLPAERGGAADAEPRQERRRVRGGDGALRFRSCAAPCRTADRPLSPRRAGVDDAPHLTPPGDRPARVAGEVCEAPPPWHERPRKRRRGRWPDNMRA